MHCRWEDETMWERTARSLPFHFGQRWFKFLTCQWQQILVEDLSWETALTVRNGYWYAGILHSTAPLCPWHSVHDILSVPFCPWHFVRSHFVITTFCRMTFCHGTRILVYMFPNCHSISHDRARVVLPSLTTVLPVSEICKDLFREAWIPIIVYTWQIVLSSYKRMHKLSDYRKVMMLQTDAVLLCIWLFLWNQVNGNVLVHFHQLVCLRCL